ncbi:Sperm-associated antigen 17 [Rhizophlyctis rosea]|uniref:Sperm-associated antigen 17 n=1 Tax=Rhizophlyctis rosea TaxID=64517 RepID=A0AAD5S1W8_9FUNG|nr:Sperm-associated antigen 17 [Rhizophlyctis rosea]
MLTNVGNDSTRFKVRQVKGLEGEEEVRVGFKPGPVAPGMHTKLSITLQASAKGQDQRQLRTEFQIVTETEIMHVGVSANILSRNAYDASSPQLAQHVILLKGEAPQQKGQVWSGASSDGMEY